MTEKIINLRDVVPRDRHFKIHTTREEDTWLTELCLDIIGERGVCRRTDWLTPNSLKHRHSGAKEAKLRDIADIIADDFMAETSLMAPTEGDLAAYTERVFPLGDQKALVDQLKNKAENLFELADRGLCSYRPVGPNDLMFTITLLGARVLGYSHLRDYDDEQVGYHAPENGWDE